jgi:hypothetical protein
MTPMGNIGRQFVELFTSSKVLSWSVFWIGWFWISPGTIIPGAIAFGVGYTFHRERAVNLVTIAAAYLGILGYLLLGHMTNDWPEQVRLWMGMAAIFAFVILGKRYPMCGYILIIIVCAAITRGRYYPYYRRRRWW